MVSWMWPTVQITSETDRHSSLPAGLNARNLWMGQPNIKNVITTFWENDLLEMYPSLSPNSDYSVTAPAEHENCQIDDLESMLVRLSASSGYTGRLAGMHSSLHPREPKNSLPGTTHGEKQFRLPIQICWHARSACTRPMLLAGGVFIRTQCQCVNR